MRKKALPRKSGLGEKQRGYPGGPAPGGTGFRNRTCAAILGRENSSQKRKEEIHSLLCCLKRMQFFLIKKKVR